MTLRHKILALSAIALFTSPTIAKADTAKDLETISKAISFITGGPSGEVSMDIVFDASNPDSVAHADEIAGLSSAGIGSGKVKLKGNKVGAASNATAQVIFVTRGASSQYSAALGKAADHSGLTVSTDDACLGAGCVLVVKTQPSVDILVSTAAAGTTGTEFASAFRMMITEK